MKKFKPPQRPPQPKLGRGNIQLAAKRLFCIQDTITTAQLVDWAYCARTEPLKSYHYQDCRRALTSIGAVRIGRAGGKHRAEFGHVAVARSGKEGVGDFEAALPLHLKAGSCFADVGPGAGGELPASGRAALDRHRDFIKIDPENVVKQEGGTFERREPLERKHKRQGDVLFPFVILLDDRLRKPRADVDLSLVPR